jgi:hypothetical protein
MKKKSNRKTRKTIFPFSLNNNDKNNSKNKDVGVYDMRFINESKIFAGIMIIMMNVATKYVPMRMSKSMEAFLRHTFSRNILVFAICWVGTRDVIISFCITIIFLLLIDYLLNEESSFCILPEAFTSYHLSLPIITTPAPGAAVVSETNVTTNDDKNKNKEESSNTPVSSIAKS